MTMRGFDVTFERYLPHPEGEDICDADERGFVGRNLSLRQALGLVAMRPEWATASEANEWPIQEPRWLSFNDYNDGTRESIEDGIREDRAVHFPERLTAASRRRIARLCGLGRQIHESPGAAHDLRA